VQVREAAQRLHASARMSGSGSVSSILQAAGRRQGFQQWLSRAESDTQQPSSDWGALQAEGLGCAPRGVVAHQGSAHAAKQLREARTAGDRTPCGLLIASRAAHVMLGFAVVVCGVVLATDGDMLAMAAERLHRGRAKGTLRVSLESRELARSKRICQRW
jgi:hypothetical protein